jgi:hypothetical protein
MSWDLLFSSKAFVFPVIAQAEKKKKKLLSKIKCRITHVTKAGLLFLGTFIFFRLHAEHCCGNRYMQNKKTDIDYL